MKTIYKYPLQIKDTQFIDMPAHAQILTAQIQPSNTRPEDLLQLWALVDTDNYKEKREIVIAGTGNPIETFSEKLWLLNYISTVQQFNGLAVWHIFERIVKPKDIQKI